MARRSKDCGKSAKDKKESRKEKKQILNAIKKAKRCNLGSLNDNLMSILTKTKYVEAMKLVLFWLFCTFGQFLPSSYDALDEALCRFIEDWWAEGEGLSLAERCVAATQFHIKNARGRLKGAWALCSSWKRLEPPRRSPPWTHKCCLAVVAILLK